MTIIRKDAAIRIHVTPEINPQYQGIANAVFAGNNEAAITLAERTLREEGYPVGITGNAINVLILELDEFTFGDVDGPSSHTLQELDTGIWVNNGTDANPRDEGFISMNNIVFEERKNGQSYTIPKIMLRLQFVRRREDIDYQHSMFTEMVEYMDKSIRHMSDQDSDHHLGPRHFTINFPLMDFDHYLGMADHQLRKHNEHRCKILPRQRDLTINVFYEVKETFDYIPVLFSFYGNTR